MQNLTNTNGTMVGISRVRVMGNMCGCNQCKWLVIGVLGNGVHSNSGDCELGNFAVTSDAKVVVRGCVETATVPPFTVRSRGHHRTKMAAGMMGRTFQVCSMEVSHEQRIQYVRTEDP